MQLERIERQPNEDFATISNAILREKTLSLNAKAVHITVMALPPNWDFTMSGLVAIVKEGRDAVYNAVKELIKAGYVERIPVRESGRFVGNRYVFKAKSEQKATETISPYPEKPDTVKPDTESPYTDSPYPEKPTQLIKQLSKETSNLKNKKERERVDRETNGKVELDAIETFGVHYPKVGLTLAQKHEIAKAIKDIPTWTLTLEYWKANNYRAESVGRLIERYKETIQKQPNHRLPTLEEKEREYERAIIESRSRRTDPAAFVQGVQQPRRID